MVLGWDHQSMSDGCSCIILYQVVLFLYFYNERSIVPRLVIDRVSSLARPIIHPIPRVHASNSSQA
jgi:hypothetical protein